MRLLVVDDNRSSANALTRALTLRGHEVEAVYGGDEAFERLDHDRYDIVLTDLKMEPIGGMEVLKRARSLCPPPEVLVFTAFGDVSTAVEAMQIGARDFLTKPVTLEQLTHRISSIEAESSGNGSAPLSASASPEPSSPRGMEFLKELQTMATVPTPVWLEGELGSGRADAAKLLHQMGPHASESLVVYNPWKEQTYPEQGSLLILGIDSLSLDQQQQLERTLAQLPQTVRVIATASPEARQKVAEGQLRGELYYSLAVLQVSVPALRERKEDIIPLLRSALGQFAERFSRPVPEFSAAHEKQLTQHAWPGNLRELNNLAERAVVMGSSTFDMPIIRPSSPGLPTLEMGFSLSGYLEALERRILSEALRKAGGDRSLTGKLLGVERNTLRYKLNKYGLLEK